ncbi:S9 family peptidase [Halioglobus maricola]|uniref:S9 family peptidase n=1 Tax=Halioglobus maricola TaxID=2601894 RepID=A0A5P9NLS9_9GAMM|nr:prolyl oligopeptidase family serine peptidase [Halioglobus maricola]QFU76790.1 S9 family peptidase [Halioglobus maricola]
MTFKPLLLAAVLVVPIVVTANEDPFIWLEDVQGEKALAWVEKQNAVSTKRLMAEPAYQQAYDATLEILDSDDLIQTPIPVGDDIYNYHQSEAHPRGILRRTSSAAYRANKPEWETVLDLDALSAEEDRPWVYKEMECFAPANKRCLLKLSPGGSDASQIREFDLETKTFVKGGLHLPTAKSDVEWIDEDSWLIGTDWGEGSLTVSTLPRQLKVLRRGQDLADAELLFEVGREDVVAYGRPAYTSSKTYFVLTRAIDFFNGEQFIWDGEEVHKLALPQNIQILAFFGDELILKVPREWSVAGTTFAMGSLVSVHIEQLLAGKIAPTLLFTPSERVSLDWIHALNGELFYATLDNVTSRLYRANRSSTGWESSAIELPGLGVASSPFTCRCPSETLSYDHDVLYYLYEDFLSPDTMYYTRGDAKPSKLKQMKALYDTEGLEVRQLQATSADGTQIPYFLVGPEKQPSDGNSPVLLLAYGGFAISKTPFYSGIFGKSWMERGGVLALANIRGGGEFGPAWHQAAVQENHMKNFEDLIAVGEDLVARKITAPEHLGIRGGSQGGLLMGGSLMLRPDLFGAVISQIPLLDMQRYTKLLNGASWISEYGDPDKPEEWAYIKTWSPYHLVNKDKDYGEPFFWTTTRDDRVHPGHARKMVAKLQSQGHPVLYFENTEGGHGKGSTNAQRARSYALEFAYLWSKLK